VRAYSYSVLNSLLCPPDLKLDQRGAEANEVFVVYKGYSYLMAKSHVFVIGSNGAVYRMPQNEFDFFFNKIGES
jgi:hypothetical protein